MSESGSIDGGTLHHSTLDNGTLSDQSNLPASSDTNQRKINGWDVTIVPIEGYDSFTFISITKGEEDNSAILYRISGMARAETLTGAFDDMNFVTRLGTEGEEASNIPVVIDLTGLEDFDVLSGQFDARIELKRIGKGKIVVVSPANPRITTGVNTLIDNIKTAGKYMGVSVVSSVWEAIQKIIYIPGE